MTDQNNVRVLEPVDFHGQALTVIDREGKPYVAMRQIVEGMSLAWPPQFKKLTDEPDRWGTVTMMVTVQSADGKERDMVCIPLKKLTGWLMTLQPSRMAEDVAAKVLVYQNECDDALWDYWTQGIAVNPRVAQKPQTQAEMLLASAQMHVEQERRLAAIAAEQAALAAKQAEITDRVEAIEARALAGSAELLALPAPVDSVDPLTDRALVVRVVRGAVFRLGVTHSEAFGKLYREFRDRTSVDLVARGRNRGQKPLDVAEADGVMAQLYAVAYEIYEAKPMPLMGPDGD